MISICSLLFSKAVTNKDKEVLDFCSVIVFLYLPSSISVLVGLFTSVMMSLEAAELQVSVLAPNLTTSYWWSKATVIEV